MTGICEDCWSQVVTASGRCNVCMQISLLRQAITYITYLRVTADLLPRERVAMERVLRGLVEFIEELMQRGVGGRPAEAAELRQRGPWGEE